ncbi:MAG: hypothetical protein ACI31V_00530 [Bacilli bacterium]
MRYVILKNKVDIEEICSRQEYLYDVFKVYTIPLYKNGIVELKSFPENVFNVLFVFGHNNQVFSYLNTNEPSEENIVLITCYTGSITKFNMSDKKIFYTNNITYKLDGKKYGFEYEITDAELNLYNCKNDSLEEKLESCFERVI